MSERVSENHGESARRVTTSAIHGYTVTDIRKLLGSMREDWRGNSPFSLFCMYEDVHSGYTRADFVTQLLIGHHSKRRKGKEVAKDTR